MKMIGTDHYEVINNRGVVIKSNLDSWRAGQQFIRERKWPLHMFTIVHVCGCGDKFSEDWAYTNHQKHMHKGDE